MHREHAALALSNGTLVDADGSVYVLMQAVLEGPGSMADALRAQYTHGLFWSVATGGQSFPLLLSSLCRCFTSSISCVRGVGWSQEEV